MPGCTVVFNVYGFCAALLISSHKCDHSACLPSSNTDSSSTPAKSIRTLLSAFDRRACISVSIPIELAGVDSLECLRQRDNNGLSVAQQLAVMARPVSQHDHMATSDVAYRKSEVSANVWMYGMRTIVAMEALSI